MKNLLTVREAVESDVKKIHELLTIYSEKAIVLARSEEDILSYIAFPQQAEQYLKRRENTFTASYTFKEVG